MAERVLVSLAVIALAAIDALYLAIIKSAGGGDPNTPLVVPFVAGYLLLMAVVLGASLPAPAGIKPALRTGVAAGLMVLGVLAAFSIGVAVLIAAGLAVAATVPAFRARSSAGSVLWAVASAVLALVILIGGFQITWSHVVCSPTGESDGSTASLIGHSFSYECKDGVLTTSR